MRAFRRIVGQHACGNAGYRNSGRRSSGWNHVQSEVCRGVLPCRHFSSDASTPSSSSTSTPKLEAEDKVPLEPTTTQLRRLAAARGMPFIGFGFLDNFLMILAGDFIDGTMCVYFGFSTMAAAALGNTISDVAGVFSGGVIEDYARTRGFEAPPLTNDQLAMTITKAFSYGGQTAGIVVGCLLGMMPLLWLDPEDANREKMKKKREAIFSTVLLEVKDILKAEASVLLFLDKEKKELQTVATESLPAFTSRIEEGIMGYVIESGRYVNIQDVQRTQWFDPKRHENYQGTGINVQSVLCMPVFGDVVDEDQRKKTSDRPWKTYEPIGVIEVINKRGGMFTRKDEDVLAAICSHVSVALLDEETTFKKVIDVCQTQMKQRAGLHSDMTGMQRNEVLFRQLLDELNSLVGTEKAGLYLIGEADGSLSLAAQSSVGESEASNKTLEDLLSHAAKTGRMIKVDDVLKSTSLMENERLALSNGGVRSLLTTPIFDNEAKVIGLLECVNKKNNTAFNSDDVELLTLIGSHIALTLEGQGSSIKKMIRIVAAMLRKRSVSPGAGQNSTAQDVGTDLERLNIVCFAHRAQGLPGAKNSLHKFSPYLTMDIVHGDPLKRDVEQPAKGKDSYEPPHTAVKSGSQPLWDEHVYLDIPSAVNSRNLEEYYVHVKLWNYDYVKENELVGQMVYPLSRIVNAQEDSTESRSFPILPVKKNGKAKFEMPNAHLHITFRTESKDEQQRATIDRRNSVFRLIGWRNRMQSKPSIRSPDDVEEIE